MESVPPCPLCSGRAEPTGENAANAWCGCAPEAPSWKPRDGAEPPAEWEEALAAADADTVEQSPKWASLAVHPEAVVKGNSVLVCPGCGDRLVPTDENYGFYCPNASCTWQLPHVQSTDEVTLTRVTARGGLFPREGRVRLLVDGEHVLANVPEGEWDKAIAPGNPVLIGRDPFEYAYSPPQEFWWYKGTFWATTDLGLPWNYFAVAALAWRDWERRRDQRAQAEAIEDAREQQTRAAEDARIEQAELIAKEERRRAKLAWADAPLSGKGARRRPIPLEVKNAVFKRDGGRCVECGTDFDIQYDHVIPLAYGGSNNEQNLQVLCGACNRRKGATLG